jgi:hypothetical protein
MSRKEGVMIFFLLFLKKLLKVLISSGRSIGLATFEEFLDIFVPF